MGRLLGVGSKEAQHPAYPEPIHGFSLPLPTQYQGQRGALWHLAPLRAYGAIAPVLAPCPGYAPIAEMPSVPGALWGLLRERK